MIEARPGFAPFPVLSLVLSNGISTISRGGLFHNLIDLNVRKFFPDTQP